MTTLLGLIGPALMFCRCWTAAVWQFDPAVQEVDVFA